MMNKINLYYITNAVVPGNRVHAYQICKMCEAFAENGLKTTLFVPMDKKVIKKDLYKLYSCKNNFKVKYIKKLINFDFLSQKKKFRMKLLVFSISVFFKFLFEKKRNTIIFTRDYIIAWLLKKIGFFVIYEAHNPILKNRYFNLLKKVDIIITNSKGTAKEFIDRGFGNVHPMPNGVDINLFDFEMNKEEARKNLKLDLKKKIVMYAGSLYKWKGIDLIITAAKSSKLNKNIIFIVLGGTKEDVEDYRTIINNEKLNNIKFLGHKDRVILSHYIKSADILLVPDLPLGKRSIHYTSPLKMFEYLISKRLVLVSDLPSMKKLVSKNEVVFFRAGDPIDFVEKINVNVHKDNRGRINKAYEFALKNSWQNRAEKIINIIKV